MSLAVIIAWVGCTLLAMGWWPCGCCGGVECACGSPPDQMSVYFPYALLTNNDCLTCDTVVGTYYADFVGRNESTGVCTWEYFAEDEPCPDIYTRITVLLDNAGNYSVEVRFGYTADLPIGGQSIFDFTYSGTCWDIATGKYGSFGGFTSQLESPTSEGLCFSMTDFGGTPFAYLQSA